MNSVYNQLKHLAKKALPETFLFKHELKFRKLYAIPYRGKQFVCNTCNSHLRSFIELDRGDLLCPVCGSLPRHRRLWQYLNQKQLLNGKVLHFSPSRALWRLLTRQTNLDYHTTDYEASPIVQYQYDITNISIGDNQYDLIICYHVLEHIVEDARALSELFRVLRPGGHLLVQTPFKAGAIYEDFSITSPAERLQHFEQEDHVRIYSVEGLKARLKNAGFNVKVEKFVEDSSNKGGFKTEEILLHCRK